MSEQDLEVLITLDDPGEDDLGEDTFHDRAAITDQPLPTGKRRDRKTIGVLEEER